MKRSFSLLLAAALACAGCVGPSVGEPAPAIGPDAEHKASVYFERDRSVLGPAAPELVAATARLILIRPYSRILVTGHADGSERDSRALSRRRAETVAQALVQNGVDAARIEQLAVGTEIPAAGTRRGARDPRNRRAEIHIFRRGG